MAHTDELFVKLGLCSALRAALVIMVVVHVLRHFFVVLFLHV